MFHIGEHSKQKPFLKFNKDEYAMSYICKKIRCKIPIRQQRDICLVRKVQVASKKPERQIPTGHRFSNKKTTTVPEKTMNPRSCLRWQPTGRILKTVCLRWVPTGKLLNSCTHGTSFNGQKQQRIDITADALYNEKQENLRVWLLNFLISKKPVPEWFTKMKTSMEMYVLNTTVPSLINAYVFNGDDVLFTSVQASVLHQMTSDITVSDTGIQDHSMKQSSSKAGKLRTNRSNGGNGNLNPIQMLNLRRHTILKAQDLKTKTSANSDLKPSR
ncbi:hypothetical protein Tco_0024369 [Tanacetum coccineum]